MEFFCLLLCTLLTLAQGAMIPVNNTESALLEFLFANYTREARPVLDVKDPVVIKFGMMLRQIIDVFWTDPLLTWNPAKFGGLTSINVEPKKVWIPDILLHNPSNTESKIISLYNKIDTKVIISNKGSVSWLAPAILKSECIIDVRHFPFDEQHCPMTFGSWTHDGLKNDVQLHQAFGIDFDVFSENREWAIKGSRGKRNVKLYSCCPEPYPTLTFTIIIRRRAMFYVYNMIFPCGMLVVLSLFSFYLPPNSGERVSFVITVLLSLSVYMLMITEYIPHSSDLPLVSKFFMASMIQVALSLAATCVVIKFDTSKKPMGRITKLLVNDWLARLIWKKNIRSSSGFFKRAITPIAVQEKRSEDEGFVITDVFNIDEQPKSGLIKRSPGSSEINQVVNELKVLTSKVHEADAADKISEDWIFAAEVLDRFFMLSFAITIVLTCISVFVASP